MRNHTLKHAEILDLLDQKRLSYINAIYHGKLKNFGSFRANQVWAIGDTLLTILQNLLIFRHLICNHQVYSSHA